MPILTIKNNMLLLTLAWVNHLSKGCTFAMLLVAFAPAAVAASDDQMPWSCHTPAGSPPCNNDYWPNYQTAATNLKTLYIMESFKALERSLKELIASERNFPAGEPLSSAPYMGFRLALPGPGALPQEEDRIKRWKAAVPNSYFVVFAEARYQFANAWNARGGGNSDSIPPEAWELYDNRLAAAKKILEGAPAELKATPLWDELALAIALSSRSSDVNIEAALKRAVKRWPRDFNLYKNTLDTLAEANGATWEAVDAFINYWSTQLRATEGTSMYARLYISRNRALLPGSKMNWTRMRTSFEDLIARYPDPYFKNLYPSYACAMGDKPAFLQAMNLLTRKEVNPSYWLSGKSYEACVKWIAK